MLIYISCLYVVITDGLLCRRHGAAVILNLLRDWLVERVWLGEGEERKDRELEPTNQNSDVTTVY
jgi:hypothetical protein